MTTHTPIELDVYLRAYAPVSGAQESVLSQARDLVDAGVAESLDVHDWPSAIRADRSTPVSRHYEDFQDWASDAGVCIDQAFAHSRAYNQFTDETREVLRPPIVSLTVRRGDELRAVLPCTVGDAHVSVGQYLDALARGDDLLGTLDTSSNEREEERPVLTA
ncbi:HTH domain-containing protein [Haloarchaeobius sp. DFWS5]|uniref:HTH domain-containing protein n=1 Tax=Haloarchaeobius sp. DFWS5 TaxID=3446114 RepID=UPI003EC0B92E